MSLKPAWLKQQVLGHTGIHNETLSQAKQNKTKQSLDSLLLQLFTVSITSERGHMSLFSFRKFLRLLSCLLPKSRLFPPEGNISI